MTVTIDWEDSESRLVSPRSVLLNGVDVTSSFPVTAITALHWRATGTITLNPGANELRAEVSDRYGNWGVEVETYTYSSGPAVAVTPDGASVTAKALEQNYYQYSLQNLTTSTKTYTLSFPTCSGVSACSAPSQVTVAAGATSNVDVWYTGGSGGTTGTVVLRASDGTSSDDGTLNVTSQWAPHLAIDPNFNNADNRTTGLCASSCFDPTISHSTVPYVSLGALRSVTLSYHGGHVYPKAFVYADVSTPGAPQAPVEYQLQVLNSSGTPYTFTNGETTLRFTAPTGVARLAGQISTASLGTGVRVDSVVVTAVYPDSRLERQSVPVTNMIVNDAVDWTVARGWTVAGVQRLHVFGDGSALVTDALSGVLYRPGCTPTSACPFIKPAGEFAELINDVSTGHYVRSYPDGTKVIFDAQGLMTRVEDRFGNASDYTYDGAGRLTRIYDPFRTDAGAHLYTELVYETNGLSEVREAAASGGRVTHYNVNASGQLTSITDPDSVSTSFTYDANGLLETVTDRRGGVTRYVYQPQTWKLASVQLPSVPVDNGAGATTPATPVVTFRPWQSVGLPTTPTAGTPFTALPPNSMIARVTDPLGRTTSFSVDRWGEPLTTIDPMGNRTVAVRTNTLPAEVHHFTAAGAESVDYFTYNGPFVTSKQLAGQPSTDYTYGVFGQVASVSGTGIPTTTYFLNSANGAVDSVDVAGKRSRYTYDSRGRILSVSDPSGHVTTTAYEAVFGNVDSAVAPGNRVVRTIYDHFGRDSVHLATGTRGDTTLYDVMNRVVKQYDGQHAQPSIYTYTNDVLTQLTDPKGLQWSYAYNALGWKTSETRPGSTASLTFRYDLGGRATSTTNRRGQRIDVRYDSLDRVVARFGSTADSLAFGYSRDGLVSTSAAFRAGSTTAHARDSVFTSKEGWTDSTVTWLAGKRFRARYTPNDRFQITATTFDVQGASGLALNDRSYGYNSTYRYLQSITVAGRTLSVGMDGELLPTTVTYPLASGSVVRTQGYTTLHQPGTSSFDNSTLNRMLGRQFGYDSLGRVVHENEVGTATPRSRDYRYDGAGQLVGADYYTVSQCTIQQRKSEDYGSLCDGGLRTEESSMSFSYDDAGNLRQLTDTTGATMTGTLDVHRLAKWGVDSLLYDLDGNRTDKLSASGNVHYDWTADGKLRSVTAGGVTVTYDYDAWGQLVRKSQGGTVVRHFLWEGGQLLAELDGSAASKVAEYVSLPGTVDSPLAILVGTDPVPHYFEQDAKHDVVGVFSGAAAAVEQTLAYDAFGRVTGVSGSLAANRLQWKGLLWEADAGLYFVRARWYDPETRRFASEDPVGAAGGSASPYAFAANDPVGKRDPSGLLVVPAGHDMGDFGCAFSRWCPIEGYGASGGVSNLSGDVYGPGYRGPCTILNGSCGSPLSLPVPSRGRSAAGWSLALSCTENRTGATCTPSGAPIYYDALGVPILPSDLSAPCRNFGKYCAQLSAAIQLLSAMPGSCGRLGRAAQTRFAIGNYWYYPQGTFIGRSMPGYAGFPGIVLLSSQVWSSQWLLVGNIAHEEGHLDGYGHFDPSEEVAIKENGFRCATASGAQ